MRHETLSPAGVEGSQLTFWFPFSTGDALNVCSHAVPIKMFADSLDLSDNFQLACQGTPAELIVRGRKLKSDTTHVIGLVV